jgi:hypothetical protein
MPGKGEKDVENNESPSREAVTWRNRLPLPISGLLFVGFGFYFIWFSVFGSSIAADTNTSVTLHDVGYMFVLYCPLHA